MYQAGELIVYSTTGVCRVDDIVFLSDSPKSSKKRQYYKLTPVYGSGTIYTPVDTQVYMRSVMTRQQALELIGSIPKISEDSCGTYDYKLLTDHYRSVLNSHDCTELVKLIKSVYTKRVDLSSKGKVLGQTDAQYMQRAENLLHGELAAVLEIQYDEVPDFIRKHIEQM